MFSFESLNPDDLEVARVRHRCRLTPDNLDVGNPDACFCVRIGRSYFNHKPFEGIRYWSVDMTEVTDADNR